MDVDLDRGANYGNTLTWPQDRKPALKVQPVEIQLDLNNQKFYGLFVALLTATTPQVHGAAGHTSSTSGRAGYRKM